MKKSIKRTYRDLVAKRNINYKHIIGSRAIWLLNKSPAMLSINDAIKNNVIGKGMV